MQRTPVCAIEVHIVYGDLAVLRCMALAVLMHLLQFLFFCLILNYSAGFFHYTVVDLLTDVVLYVHSKVLVVTKDNC